MTKKYYDDEAIKRIERMTTSGKPYVAYRELADYMSKYPNDNYSHIINADILLQIGKPEEALQEIEMYKDEPMHGYMVENSIATIYGSILIELGRYEEGEEQLKKAIELYKQEHQHESCSALNRLFKHYLNQRNSDEALKLLNRCKKTPSVQIKKAQIYIIRSDFEKAIRLLSNIREDTIDNDKLLGQYYYLYGKTLYYIKDFENASIYLRKSIEAKSAASMKALAFLGHIACNRFNYNLAIKYGEEIVKHKSFTSHGNELLARAYTETQAFDQAQESVNGINDYYWQNFRLARLYYAKKDYKNAELIFCKLLNCNVEKFFDENLNYYILCKFRQGKYEEASYIIDCVEEQGIIPTKDMDLIRVFISSLNRERLDKSKLSYSGKQVYSYDKDKAIHHIIDHHVVDSRMSEFNDVDIRRIYNEVYKRLCIANAVPDTYFDKHVIYYKDIGMSIPNKDEDSSEVINQLEVITLPCTKDILTMYPRKGTDAFLDETDKPEQGQVKRLSQIDKFNKKYGLK